MSTTTEQVWQAFHTPLQQFIRRRVSDEATAEDLLQDVFLKIHHLRTTSAPSSNFTHYLTKNCLPPFSHS
jgi:DNA-directed RNA polymerase specialized sigma24 family protein